MKIENMVQCYTMKCPVNDGTGKCKKEFVIIQNGICKEYTDWLNRNADAHELIMYLTGEKKVEFDNIGRKY